MNFMQVYIRIAKKMLFVDLFPKCRVLPFGTTPLSDIAPPSGPLYGERSFESAVFCPLSILLRYFKSFWFSKVTKKEMLDTVHNEPWTAYNISVVSQEKETFNRCLNFFTSFILALVHDAPNLDYIIVSGSNANICWSGSCSLYLWDRIRLEIGPGEEHRVK